MKKQYDLKRMADTISLLREKTQELQKMAKDFPAVEKNTDRMLASIKMLELNVSDPVTFSNIPKQPF